MPIFDYVNNNFMTAVNKFGQTYWLYTTSSTYDDYDEETLSVAGSSTGSCIVLPVSESSHGNDYMYLQQGLVKMRDLKAFMPSGTDPKENDRIIVGGGSYLVLRSFPWPAEGMALYNKVYLRSEVDGPDN